MPGEEERRQAERQKHLVPRPDEHEQHDAEPEEREASRARPERNAHGRQSPEREARGRKSVARELVEERAVAGVEEEQGGNEHRGAPSERGAGHGPGDH